MNFFAVETAAECPSDIMTEQLFYGEIPEAKYDVK